MRWIDVGPGIHARRYTELDQTLGLVIGQTRCLVIDTGTDETHGAEFAAAIRELTDLPWTVVITHAHFDHFLGTAAFPGADVHAHTRCRAEIATGDHAARWAQRYRDDNKPELADRIANARVVLPTHDVLDRTHLDLGNRTVTLLHPGPAHTDHDVAVHIPDANVVFAGDLVEQGAPPSIGTDAHPAKWPGALDVLLALRPTTVVPGHGEPVDARFVAEQRDQLSAGST